MTESKAKYGVRETSPLSDNDRKFQESWKGEYVDWSDPDLKRVTRLRLLSDPGFPMWDVSYCFGEMKDGRCVRVQLPFDQLPKGGKLQKTIVEYAKRDKVYAKGLGILDAISTLN
jgi:hypothetical protein